MRGTMSIWFFAGILFLFYGRGDLWQGLWNCLILRCTHLAVITCMHLSGGRADGPSPDWPLHHQVSGHELEK